MRISDWSSDVCSSDLGARLGVRHEDLRCRLFDDRAGDPAFEGVLCALGRKADNTAQLADRLLPILDPADEDIVIERLPALVDDDDRGAAVEPLLDPMEDRKSTRLNSSPYCAYRMPSSVF